MGYFITHNISLQHRFLDFRRGVEFTMVKSRTTSSQTSGPRMEKGKEKEAKFVQIRDPGIDEIMQKKYVITSDPDLWTWSTKTSISKMIRPHGKLGCQAIPSFHRVVSINTGRSCRRSDRMIESYENPVCSVIYVVKQFFRKDGLCRNNMVSLRCSSALCSWGCAGRKAGCRAYISPMAAMKNPGTEKKPFQTLLKAATHFVRRKKPGPPGGRRNCFPPRGVHDGSPSRSLRGFRHLNCTCRLARLSRRNSDGHRRSVLKNFEPVKDTDIMNRFAESARTKHPPNRSHALGY